ncbi:SpoIIE family protein phosphatase [Uniformispora flossi]|uniref:SpoIIE family protein phosphatase n=1 Tax=Uniformispora flossi TaxID=3390723 RepID=UPI003C2D9ADE
MNITRWGARLAGERRRSVPAARMQDRIDTFSLREVLAHAPALIAVTRGPAHELAYVNQAYRDVFGPRRLGVPARDILPELADHGLLPLMDQVYRTGRGRTVRARRVDHHGTAYPGMPESERQHGYFTFVCTPVCADGTPGDAAVRGRAGVRGVLVFAVDVTDQVQATDRLRESERRHRQAAVTLQRSLLPQQLEHPDDLRVSARYLPGGADAAVGGDWYDVITLGAGRTALVIGDVMGRGVRAAAVMGQLRTAVRAYARLDLPPHEVLQLLDGLAMEIDATQIATCVYAVHDPSEGVLTYSTAGHLPPLVRDPAGDVHRLDDALGPPLGTGGSWPHTSGGVPLEPGSTVVFYTDGLVERRGEDIDRGIDDLAAALDGAAGPPDAVRDRLIEHMRLPVEHDDDVALLVLHLPRHEGRAATLFRTASLDLLGGNEVAARARAFTSGVLASWQVGEELRESGVLAVSEFVANALTHGAAPMRLRLRRTDRRLIVEVSDADDHVPRHRRASADDENGRGVAIVASIASSWGSRLTATGKTVWCEFLL